MPIQVPDMILTLGKGENVLVEVWPVNSTSQNDMVLRKTVPTTKIFLPVLREAILTVKQNTFLTEASCCI